LQIYWSDCLLLRIQTTCFVPKHPRQLLRWQLLRWLKWIFGQFELKPDYSVQRVDGGDSIEKVFVDFCYPRDVKRQSLNLLMFKISKYCQQLKKRFGLINFQEVWSLCSGTHRNTSEVAMLLPVNQRGGYRAELVGVEKRISKPVSFCSSWKVALEFVCFRFFLAKAYNSARAQNSELLMWHYILTIVKLQLKPLDVFYLLLREKVVRRHIFIFS